MHTSADITAETEDLKLLHPFEWQLQMNNKCFVLQKANEKLNEELEIVKSRVRTLITSNKEMFWALERSDLALFFDEEHVESEEEKMNKAHAADFTDLLVRHSQQPVFRQIPLPLTMIAFCSGVRMDNRSSQCQRVGIEHGLRSIHAVGEPPEEWLDLLWEKYPGEHRIGASLIYSPSLNRFMYRSMHLLYRLPTTTISCPV